MCSQGIKNMIINSQSSKNVFPRKGKKMDETMLGREIEENEYGRLDTFEIDGPMRINFYTKELQALCPSVEGIQPDIYETTLSYRAVTHAIESKSLKLWLVQYRNQRIFGEHLAIELHRNLSSLNGIDDVQVRLVQNIRGGIITDILYPSEI
jgi:NADPH-dependent 7-cyano-7-deazaguanine reductase QueF